MPTQNLVARVPSDLREMAEARADQEDRYVTGVVISALRAYLTGDDAGEAYHHTVRRLAELKAENAALRAELEAARMGVLRKQATAADRDARARLAADREDRFAGGLEAATRENPATPAGQSRASGFSYYWSRDLLSALAAAGYAEKVADGRYVPVPGADIREGIGKAKRLAQHGAARIAPSKREASDGSSPAPAPAVPAGEATGAPAPTGLLAQIRSDEHRRGPLSAEHKAAVSAALKGKPKSAEHVAKVAAAQQRRPVSAETRAKISTSLKRPRKPASPPVAAEGQQAVITELREQVPDLVMASELPAAPVFKAGPDVDCMHENMRIRKGVCPDCKQWVTK